MDSFLTEHKDFVLKLKIETIDGNTQVRRVKLPRIADDNGCVSYSELVGLVVTFVFPEDPSVGNYHVSLSYVDVDSDVVTIASTDELVDAVEQFAGDKVLRITTEVKPKAGVSVASTATKGTSTTAAPPPLPLPAAITAASSDGSCEPPINTILESFVGALANTVVSLNDGLQEGLKRRNSTTSTFSGSVDEAVKAAAKVASEANVGVPPPAIPRSIPIPEKSREVTPEVKPTTTTTPTPTPTEETEIKKELVPLTKPPAAKSAPTPATTKKPAPKAEAAPKKQEKEEEKPKKNEKKGESRPFIHGRHTCDGCYRTPIVGERFHAKNVKDYDLCENCVKNYKGSEITFESVELERDRAFQDRWHRRRDRMLAAGKSDDVNCRPLGRRCGRPDRPSRPGRPGRRGCNGNGHRPNGPPGPPPPPPPPPPPHHHHPHGPPHHFHPHHPHMHPHFAPHMRAHQAPHMHPHTPHNADYNFDGALREAIRRSLEEEDSKQPAIENKEEKEAKEASQTSVEEKKADVADEPKPIETKKEEAVMEAKNEVPLPSAPVEEEEEIVVEPAASINQPPPEEKKEEEIVVKPVAVAATLTRAAPLLVVETVSEEDAARDLVVQEQRSVISPSPASLFEDKKPEASTSVNASPISRAATEDSFASDAIGNGDVAQVIGSTLDTFAGMINELLDEANDERPTAPTLIDAKCEAVETKEEVPDSVETSEEADNGAMILESTENDDNDDDNSAMTRESDEWHVVSENRSNDDTYDEEVAAAAQMLGSAMFNSDMQADSSISSVPSQVPSLAPSITETQRTRWSSQLRQLSELGLVDEALNVDVLERLEAARIGCDEEEEVTVTQVVNEIYKNL